MVVCAQAQTPPPKPVPAPVAKPALPPQAPKAPPRLPCKLQVKGPPELLIQRCTELIESGQEVGAALADAHNTRGRAYFAKGEHDRAIADFTEALRNEPGNLLSMQWRALAYSAKLDFEAAVRDLSEAIWRAPRDVSLYQDRSKAYVGLMQYQQAIADLDQVVKLSPKPAAALRERCYVRAISGRELLAGFNDCNEALRLLKNDTLTLERRGLVSLRLGYFDRAISDYDAVLKVQGGNAAALYGRGVARMKKGETMRGEADIAEARQIRPQIVEMLAGFGVQ